MQLDDLVEWLGEVRRTELIALMHSCDCFISASRWESFGVVLVEALACGKPLIATDSGGPRDIVNEINGILVENENPTALAEAMESMLYGHEKYSPDLIRADYLTKYSTTVIASRYANEVYNPILNKPSLH